MAGKTRGWPKGFKNMKSKKAKAAKEIINDLESQPKNGSPETAKNLKPSHALFSRGLCRWTGCEAELDSFESFS